MRVWGMMGSFLTGLVSAGMNYVVQVGIHVSEAVCGPVWLVVCVGADVGGKVQPGCAFLAARWCCIGCFQDCVCL
ncbi:hypothetical protein SOVF_192860 [Spinacia oleracea]|nr:hypothetical protein SOVF_192860 [Spinacia oleracea]